MVNILLEGYDIAVPWLRDELERYIRPEYRVTIVAFSFRDGVSSVEDWAALYGRENGKYYGGIIRGFLEYGMAEENIRFINYFSDDHETAKKAVEEADIVYFPGGLPDRMMERIEEFELYETLRRFDGIVMGYSAGAVIQLAEYHLSPDDDYPEFGYYSGIGYMNEFYLEVHYEDAPLQNAAIRRVLKERGKTTYATYAGAGAIIVDSGDVRLLGDVRTFEP